MAVEVGDIIRVAARCEFNGQDDVVNVYHFEVFEVPTAGNINDLLEDVSEHMSTAYAVIDGYQSNLLSSVDITVFNVTQDAPYGTVGWTNDYDGGTVSGEAMPPQDALLILWRTNIKRRVGRTYIGALCEAHQSAGVWNGTILGDMQTFALSISSGTGLANGSSLRLVVYSRSEGEGTVPSVYSARPLVAIMGRRKRGRGS